MKSIKLILITVIGLFFTANVFGQTIVHPVDISMKQTVASGAAYTYVVDLHKTQNLLQIGSSGDQDNYYIWKVYESDATGVRGDLKRTYTDFTTAIGKHEQLINWTNDITDFAKNKYYLVVVSEHPNHGGEADDVDQADCVLSESEFFVYVGDNFNIEITDKNKYYCFDAINNTGAEATAKNYENIGLRFNGKAPWTITFNVVAKDGTATITNKDVVVTAAEVTSDVDGYFTYSMPLSRIDAGEMSGDASLADLYYTFEIVNVKDANALDGLVDNDKNIEKIYGVYTNPKVTKITFK